MKSNQISLPYKARQLSRQSYEWEWVPNSPALHLSSTSLCLSVASPVRDEALAWEPLHPHTGSECLNDRLRSKQSTQWHTERTLLPLCVMAKLMVCCAQSGQSASEGNDSTDSTCNERSRAERVVRALVAIHTNSERCYSGLPFNRERMVNIWALTGTDLHKSTHFMLDSRHALPNASSVQTLRSTTATKLNDPNRENSTSFVSNLLIYDMK